MLGLVRERCRRSESAWSALADKAQRGEPLRIEDQKRKAAEAHRFQMKMIFKKNQPKRASLRASAERRESEQCFRPFDKVAYAAVLEMMD
jgi:hypothetical protein